MVLAPAIGPTIGGWITDNYSWRWIFYINVPISIVSLYLTYTFVEDPPYLSEEREKAKRGGIDYIGLGLVALGIGCLQMVMDKGQELDWFGSHLITIGLIVAVSILIFWIVWEWRHSHPIVELKLLKNRNFAAAIFSMFTLGTVLYGTTVLLPEFLQTLMGYTAAQAGECMALGGFLMMFTMPMSGALSGKMDPRILLAFGYAATSAGLYHMATHLSLGMDFGTAAMLRTYQVAGLAFIFIPSNVLCYAGIPREKNNQVSSMMNFVRNIGGSIGIALVSTMVTRSYADAAGLSLGQHAERQSTLSRDGRRHFRHAARRGGQRGAGHSPGVHSHCDDDGAAGLGPGIPRCCRDSGSRGHMPGSRGLHNAATAKGCPWRQLLRRTDRRFSPILFK